LGNKIRAAQPSFEVTREQKQKIWKTDKERREDSRTDAVVFLLLAIAIAIATAIAIAIAIAIEIKTILTTESS
jgi:type IV secretory pathway component VirB8